MFNSNVDAAVSSGSLNIQLREPNKSENDNNAGICKFYAFKGWCSFGNRCKFVHNGPSLRPSKSNNYNDRETEHLNRSMKNLHIRPNNNTNEAGNAGGPSNTICRTFSRTGWCVYGQDCRFKHIINVDTNYQRSYNTRLFRGSTSTAMAAKRHEGINPETSSNHHQGERLQNRNHRPMNIELAESYISSNIKPVNKNKKPCQFYQKGWCRNGRRCPFLHIKKIRMEQSDVNVESEVRKLMDDILNYVVDTVGNNVNIGSDDEEFMDSDVLSDEMSNSEDSAVMEDPDPVENLIMAAPVVNVTVKPPVNRVLAGRPKHILSTLSADDLKRLRELEIEQLKKRFTKDALQVLEASKFLVEVRPTDPNWPYSAVSSINLLITVPEDYPQKVCDIVVLEEHNESFPTLLIRHLNATISNWVQEKHSHKLAADEVELLIRPFLHWFDRNAEDIFTSGLRKTKLDINAKASGLEFVPFENLTGPSVATDEEQAEQDFTDAQFVPTLTGNNADLNSYIDKSAPKKTAQNEPSSKNVPNFMTPQSGTEVKFLVFEMGDNIASIMCDTIKLTVQCSRCKTRHDITTPAKRTNSFSCSKCNSTMRLAFRPCLIHQCSQVLGYLDMEGCHAFDVIIMDCSFSVTCLSCDKHSKINGIHYGILRTAWCHTCNSKFILKIETAKFHRLQTTRNFGNAKGHVIQLEKRIRNIKDPSIQEGKPLPDNGTCKHYKKSFRWFRFPCCGKTYPCDLCHEEKEDHELKIANRVICGFCSKEQTCTSKPCITCSSGMVKAATVHWEGGKGCRDKAKMSRDDKHKYAGLNKTLAKKVQDKKLVPEKVKS